MKLAISPGPARAAALTAIAARLFVALTVETGSIHNGAWISALLGGLLAVPWLLAVSRLGMRRSPVHDRAMLPLRIALLAALALDASRVLSDITRSAGYLALDRSAPVTLLLPACLAALWCASRGGGAVGYGAMIWARLFTAIMLLVALLQFRHYRPEWLLPILGPGWRGIALSGARSAGHIMLASGVLLAVESDNGDDSSGKCLLRSLAVAVGVAALLIALRLMMTPTMLRGDETFLYRLDSLIANGRAPLYLQLPMIALWFAGLMHLLACECFAASAMLQRLLPFIDGRVCAALTVLTSGLMSRFAAPGGAGFESFSTRIAVALPLCASFALVAPLKMGGGKPSCAR